MKTALALETPFGMALVDEALPTLTGAAALLRAMAVAHDHDLLSGEDASAALLVVAAQLDAVSTLLERCDGAQGAEG
jgi:hypothetical protein